MNRLASGKHRGYKYEIWHKDMGYRCGYIEIPPGHPWWGVNYEEIPATCHGGLTYGQFEGDTYVIGFDCAHHGDAPDPKLPGYLPFFYGDDRGVVRDQTYVREQCKSLCEQARECSGDEILIPDERGHK